METSAKEQEYIRVKNSLEALGFTGYLSPDSVTLVRNILDNLIKATRSFKNIKLENERLQDEMRLQGDLVLPLRNENHKLLQDNNQLHKEIIDIKDKLEIKNTTSDKTLQKNIENMEEMKFLLTQKNLKIKSLEAQVENLKKKLNDVFEDVYMYNKEENADQRGIPSSRKFLNYGNGYLPELCPLIKQEFNISGGEQMNQINYGNNNMEINPNEILEAMQNENKQFNLGKDEWAKDLQQNNNEITKLRENINNLENMIKEKNKEIEQYQRRIILRDDEIKRLQNNAYLGDENLEEIKVRYNIDFYREQNEQLKRQNEFLNNENHRLNSLKIFHSKQGKEEEINKLKNEIEKLKFDNNKLKQRNVYPTVNTTNTRRKKNFTENSKMSFGTAEIKEDKEKKENMKYQKIIRDLTGNNENIKAKLTIANKTINELKNQNQLLQNENDFLKKKVISLEKENNAKNKNINNNINYGNNKELLEQINDLKNKNIILFEENKKFVDELKQKDSEIINNLNIHQKETDEINKEINLIKNQNNDLLITKKSLEEEISILRNKINIESNNIRNENNLSSNNTLNQFNDSNKIDEILRNYKDTQSNLESQNKQKDQEIKLLNEQKEKFESENKILEIKNKNLNEQIIKLQNEILSNTREDNMNEHLKESNNELKSQIEKQNSDINNLEKKNLELKNIIIGIQNESNINNLNQNEQTQKMNEIISKLQKDNNKLIKNLELFKQENHLAAEKIKKLEEIIGNK
jgi:centrosomal protein CEP135